MNLDSAVFNREVILHIIRVTEASPLYIEDLMRLTATVCSADEAIRQWEERAGNEARRCALGRECELLSPNARKVLLAGCICPGQVSFPEIEAVTGLSSDVITAALKELQRLFLVPKPRLTEGEQRFEINFNTRALVREAYVPSDQYRRLEDAYRIRSEGVSKIGRGNVKAIIRQAIFLLKTSKHREAEQLLQNALLKYPNDPDVIGILGLVYKAWSPPRVTDAREKFIRAWQLKSSSPDMYERWYKLEAREQEWTKAAQAAENGLKNLE
jgi:Coatomer epsilon subunit